MTPIASDNDKDVAEAIVERRLPISSRKDRKEDMKVFEHVQRLNFSLDITVLQSLQSRQHIRLSLMKEARETHIAYARGVQVWMPACHLFT